MLVSARDLDDNSFEVLQNGKQRLYEHNSYIEKKCPVCAKNKEKLEKQLGDRLIVLNRDYSGYEILSSCTSDENMIKTPSADLIYETNTHFCCQFEMEIYDKDVNVEKCQVPGVEFDKQSVVSSEISEKVQTIKSQTSDVKSKKRKRKKSIFIEPEVILELSELAPPWITENLSISEDVASDLKMLMQYYNNPLDKLTKCLSVK